jgi:hypothetical protein
MLPGKLAPLSNLFVVPNGSPDGMVITESGEVITGVVSCHVEMKPGSVAEAHLKIVGIQVMQAEDFEKKKKKWDEYVDSLP